MLLDIQHAELPNSALGDRKSAAPARVSYLWPSEPPSSPASLSSMRWETLTDGRAWRTSQLLYRSVKIVVAHPAIGALHLPYVAADRHFSDAAMPQWCWSACGLN